MADREERHYAVLQLEGALRNIRQARDEMPVLRQKIEKHRASNQAKAKEFYIQLQKQQKSLTDALNQCRLSLLEMEWHDRAEHAAKLAAAIGRFQLMTPDYTKWARALTDFTEGTQTTNAAVIGRLMNSVKLGYYPTDPDHIRQITRGIAFPDGVTTNVLDPCCGCGLALRTLAQGNNCYAYGVELDEHRAEEAQTRLHRVGFGSFFHSRVSHEAFHVMLLNPPYLSVLGRDGSHTRHEKRFLAESLYHLIIGGLLIYIIPYYRLTPDICRILCDNFSDLTVWKFGGKEFEKYKQVAVLGLRQKRTDGSALAAQMAQFALQPDVIRELTELPEDRYALPGKPVPVNLFKGAKFNEAELAGQLKKSKSFSALFEKSKLDSGDKQPLLPLNIGQIGLIGGSGLINGLIDCESPHVIKGRIVKQTRTEHTERLNARGEAVATDVREIVSNKMIFNILTPQGFKSLT